MPETRTVPNVRRESEAAAPPHDGRLPIVVGVTGHREFRDGDDAAIAADLRTLFDRLLRDCPHSPMLILTSLAEGADRVVALAALQAGAHLIAVLPLEQRQYEADFGGAESREAFRSLLAHERTVRCIVVPRLGPDVEVPGDARNLQYLLSGLFIARHCDILVALWDGRAARGVGGTGQIVSYMQSGRLVADPRVYAALSASPAPFGVLDAPLDAPRPGLVYHIPAARPDDATASRSSAAWLVPPGRDSSARARDAYVSRSMLTLRRRDAFNRECSAFRERHGTRVDAARAMLTRGEHVSATSLGDLRESFALADSLAVSHQTSMYRMLVALFLLAGAATVSLLLRNLATTESARRVYLAGYLLLLAVGDLAYLRTRWRRSQDRFQDYRALAEGVRVQFFWRVAGLAHTAADYYLRRQRSELRWIRDALGVCALRAAPPHEADTEATCRLWVEDQARYYRRAAIRDGARGRRQRTIGSALVLLSLGATVAWLWSESGGRPAFAAIALVAVLVLTVHCAYEASDALRKSDARRGGAIRATIGAAVLGVVLALALYGTIAYGGPLIAARGSRLAINDSPMEWMLAAIGITALVGTFAHAYATVRAFGEQQKQYERMEELFGIAGEQLSRTSPALTAAPEAAQRVLFDLGCESLAEHADWLLLHRSRPIELPTAEI